VYQFAKEGEEVIIVSRTRKKLDYLSEVEDRITFIPGDILNFPKLTEIFMQNREKISGIVHTVALTLVLFHQAGPAKGISINVNGTVNMLELARIFQIKKFLYISSGAVYGDVRDRPSEITHPPRPSDLYGTSKACCEMIGQQYERYYGLDFRTARLYFLFGPPLLPSQQTFDIFRCALGPLEGLTGLELEKGADQRNGFTYIKDAALGCYLLYEAEDIKQKTVNIATEEVVSLSEIVKLSQKYSDMPTQVKIGPGKFWDRADTLDISVAKEQLKFCPKYSTEESIKDYAEWVKKNRGKSHPNDSENQKVGGVPIF